MLNIKIASDDPQSMSQDGSSILRSLQNKSLPMVDLVVRESVQNSLDATKDGEQYTEVDFRIEQFNTVRLAKEFQGIEEKLQSKYSNNNYFLSITDKNTSGLTGEVDGSSTKELGNSNFYKLVFGIGKNQETEGAGGSWGLGKTSYFRIGIGLVIYYTRVLLSSGDYEERLIGSLIEDNKKSDRLLQRSERGIAWWGEIKKNDFILPITDSERIKEILDIFDLEPYQGKETGTRIIIPYLSDQFIQKDYPKDSKESSCYWLNDISLEIQMAIQRWYFPRINNKTYRLHIKQSMLLCKVNGTPVLDFNLENTFSILQKIYNSALLGNPVEDSITVYPILLKRKGLEDKNQPVGHVAFQEVSKKEANMLPPNNSQSPFAYLGNFDSKAIDEHNGKFLGYCRKPGMIVEYDFDNNWLPSGVIQRDDTVLFSLFVPSSSVKLDSKHYPSYPTVESYLRSIENADHANWVDENGLTFIKRIKKNVVEIIKEHFQVNEYSTVGSATTRLSKMLGNAILPPTGFGNKSSHEKESITKEKRQSSTKASLTIEDFNIIDEGTVEVLVSGRIPKDKSCTIKMLVETQESRLDKDKWRHEFENIDFPFEIISLKTIDSSQIEESDLSLDNGVLTSEKFDEDKHFKLLLKIKKSTNQYAPLIVINS
ncbi:TPA: hypothetical protein ACGO5C_001906 [Streptococcus suis]